MLKRTKGYQFLSVEIHVVVKNVIQSEGWNGVDHKEENFEFSHLEEIE